MSSWVHVPVGLAVNLGRLLGRSDFRTKIVETLGVRSLVYLMAFASVVLVARVLGPDARGLYAVAVSLSALVVQLGNGGLYAANAYRASRNPADVPALLGNSLAASLLIGGVGAILSWVVLTIWPSIAPVTGLLLVLAVAWVPLGLAKLLIQYLLLGVHEVRAYNSSELLSAAVGLVLLASLAITDRISVEAAFATTLVSAAVAAAFALGRIQSASSHPLAFSWQLFRQIQPYGLRVYWSALVAFITFRLDLVLVDAFLGNEQAGYYSIVLAMADVLLLAPVVVGTLLFPRLSAMASQAQRERSATRAAIGVGMFSVVAAAISAILAPSAVSLVFGAAYLPAVPSFWALLPGVVLVSVYTIYMNLIASNGMPLAGLLPPIIGMTLNLVLDFYLIPNMGIVGASAASSLAYAAMLIASVAVRDYVRTENTPQEFHNV